MSSKAFRDNLKTVLAADAGLSAWATTNFNTAFKQIDGNRDVTTLRSNELPAMIYESADGKWGTPAIGGEYQEANANIPVALVFYDKDPATAVTKVDDLTALFRAAIIANRTLIGPGTMCYPAEWSNSRGTLHPHHVVRFIVNGQYEE